MATISFILAFHLTFPENPSRQCSSWQSLKWSMRQPGETFTFKLSDSRFAIRYVAADDL